MAGVEKMKVQVKKTKKGEGKRRKLNQNRGKMP